MNSIEKLKRLTGEKAKELEKPSPKQAQIDELRRKMDAIISRRAGRLKPTPQRDILSDAIHLAKVVPGEEMENKHGKFFLVSDLLAGKCLHGCRNISETFGLDMKAAAILANDPVIGD